MYSRIFRNAVKIIFAVKFLMIKILFKIFLSVITAVVIMLEIFAFLNNLFGIETLVRARAGIFFIILFPFLASSLYRLISYSNELKGIIQKFKKKLANTIAVFVKNTALKINDLAEKTAAKILYISISDKFIEDFIKKSLSEGLPENQIIGKLYAAGCEKEKIAAAFSKIEGKIKDIKLEKEEKSRNKEQTFLIETKKILKGTKMIDLSRLALRIFKVKPTRTILTILGIGVSFGVILFLVSLGYGLQNHLLRQISSAESLLTLDVLSPNTDALVINSETVKQFSRIPNILKVSPVAIVNGQLNLNGISYEAVFTGVSPSFKESSALDMVSGEFFKTAENEIVVSSFFLKLFNKDSNELLNNEAYLTFFIPEEKSGSAGLINTFKENSPFKITGVVEDETNNFIYAPFPSLEKLNLPSYGAVKIRVANSDSLEETRSKILEMGFSVSTVSDTVEQANKIFNALQIVLALFGIAALIVAVIGMINTMTIALLERIQEIGIMKVIGASDRDVEKLFLLESAVIGFLGGISGLLIGFISSQLFNIGINALANALGGTRVNLFYYPLWFIIVIVVFSSLVGILTGALPARKAGKMDPLQALRYK